MSILDQLWDDTVASPRPETGLGKLRKQSTLGFRSNNSGKESSDGNVRSIGDTTDEPIRVTRSIMIMKPPTQGDQIGTPPASPAGSTPPVSPLSGKLDCSYSVMSDFPICKLLICCTAVSKYNGAWSGGLEDRRVRVW